MQKIAARNSYRKFSITSIRWTPSSQLSPPLYHCWNCKAVFPEERTIENVSCNKCHAIQPLGELLHASNYFQLLQVSNTPMFDINLNQMEKNFKKLQKQYHPDKFAISQNETEKQISQKSSSMLNLAYDILKDPQKRAQYLLELNHIALEETLLPQVFLLHMLELMENISNLEPEEHEELQRIAKELHGIEKEIVTKLNTIFEKKDFEAAKLEVAKLNYMKRAYSMLQEKL